MPLRLLLLILLPGLLNCHRASPTTQPTAVYYPAKGNAWAHRPPAQVGMDAARLDSAVAFAKTQETTQMAPDFSTQEQIFGKLLGPMPTSRAKTNGLVVRHGYIVAEWGDTDAVDPTYSVAKSLLSTVLGISLDRGIVKDIHDPVVSYVHDGGYESAQNRLVTWQHHAQQTSEWAGNMWGKNSDFVGREAFGQGERKPRELKPPGTYWEYNDVRINRFALALLRIWKKPLPDVVRDEIFTPIAHPIPGSTFPIQWPWLMLLVSRCRRSVGAHAGAVGCASVPATKPGLGICFCATVAGRISNSCLNGG